MSDEDTWLSWFPERERAAWKDAWERAQAGAVTGHGDTWLAYLLADPRRVGPYRDPTEALVWAVYTCTTAFIDDGTSITNLDIWEISDLLAESYPKE